MNRDRVRRRDHIRISRIPIGLTPVSVFPRTFVPAFLKIIVIFTPYLNGLHGISDHIRIRCKIMSLFRKIVRFKSDRATKNLRVIFYNPPSDTKQRIRLLYIFNDHPSQIFRNLFHLTQQRTHAQIRLISHTFNLILGLLRQRFR